jgi:ATP-binding cassette, subfamily G (WHITE), member 2, PDR
MVFQTGFLTEGAVPGQETVSGAAWLEVSYGYSINHLWRNFGIIIAFFVFFTVVFLIAVEFKSPPESRGEVLVFPIGKEPHHLVGETGNGKRPDVESGQNEPNRQDGATAIRQTTSSGVEAMKRDLNAPQDIFTWRNVCCDVHIKSETRRLLSNVSGYVKPGTLTALMGESGAGKTTLLDTYISSFRSV